MMPSEDEQWGQVLAVSKKQKYSLCILYCYHQSKSNTKHYKEIKERCLMGDKYCINCGDKVMDGAAYCQSCGSRIGRSPAKRSGSDVKRSGGVWGQTKKEYAGVVRPVWMKKESFGEFTKMSDVWRNHSSKLKAVPMELLNNKWRMRGLIFSVIGVGALFLPFIKTSIFGVEFTLAAMLEVDEVTMPAMIICGIILNLLSFWKVFPIGGYGGGALLLGTAYIINQQVAGSSLGDNIIGMLLVAKGSGFYALLISGIGSIFCAFKLGKAVKEVNSR